jgi:hypothetical protein
VQSPPAAAVLPAVAPPAPPPTSTLPHASLGRRPPPQLAPAGPYPRAPRRPERRPADSSPSPWHLRRAPPPDLYSPALELLQLVTIPFCISFLPPNALSPKHHRRPFLHSGEPPSAVDRCLQPHIIHDNTLSSCSVAYSSFFVPPHRQTFIGTTSPQFTPSAAASINVTPPLFLGFWSQLTPTLPSLHLADARAVELHPHRSPERRHHHSPSSATSGCHGEPLSGPSPSFPRLPLSSP